MKTNIATTPEQSQRLIACGVNPNTCDLAWQVPITLSQKRKGDRILIFRNPNRELHNSDIPAWSLSALLDSVLPKHLEDFPLTKWRPPFLEDEIWEMDNEGVLNGDVKLYSNGSKWIVDYDWDGFSGTLPQSENPIEAVVLAIELLHANGYKLNELNQ